MKGSLIVVGFFALGCLLGWSGYLPGVIIENDITVYVLYSVETREKHPESTLKNNAVYRIIKTCGGMCKE